MKIQSSQFRPARVTLRTVAERVGLAPCSVSAVLNDSAAALAIPQRTKLRVLQAARELNYHPNLAARSLRTRRTYTIAVLVSDIGDPVVASAVAGVENALRRKGYALLVTRAEFDPRALAAQAIQLRQRGVEGVIAVDTLPPRDLALPFEMVELPNQARSESAAKRLRTELEDTGAASAWRLLRKVEQTVVLHRDRPIEKVNPLAPTVAEIAKIGDAATASPFQFAD